MNLLYTMLFRTTLVSLVYFVYIDTGIATALAISIILTLLLSVMGAVGDIEEFLTRIVKVKHVKEDDDETKGD